MTTELILKISLAVITIISALVTGILIPYIRSKTTAEQRQHALTLAKYAVMAAEQIFKESGQGEKKKKFVINYLAEQGIKLTIYDLNVLIESAVKELNVWQNELSERIDG